MWNCEKSAARIENDLNALQAFTSTPGAGCTRLPFTKETRTAADYLKQAMATAGLAVTEDAAGNVIGVRAGRDRSLPAIVCGSHYDSVVHGGNYDGIAGVVCAIELARVLEEEHVTLAADYVAIAFMDEEGCRFGTGYFGSRAVLGEMDAAECRTFSDLDGITVYDAMKSYGLDPERIADAAWPAGRLGRYFEIHIEQGRVLETCGADLGIVSGIVGIRRARVTIEGRADHAGATPMHLRRDAVDMAAQVIVEAGRLARQEKESGAVATIGCIEADPGAVNVIAGRAAFSIDVRSTDAAAIERILAGLRRKLDDVTHDCGASWTAEQTLAVAPVRMSEDLQARLSASAASYQYATHVLPSGAGHDALPISSHAETAMLFVPSRNGRSHAPEEYTPPPAFAKAVHVLFDVLRTLPAN